MTKVTKEMIGNAVWLHSLDNMAYPRMTSGDDLEPVNMMNVTHGKQDGDAVVLKTHYVAKSGLSVELPIVLDREDAARLCRHLQRIAIEHGWPTGDFVVPEALDERSVLGQP